MISFFAKMKTAWRLEYHCSDFSQTVIKSDLNQTQRPPLSWCKCTKCDRPGCRCFGFSQMRWSHGKQLIISRCWVTKRTTQPAALQEKGGRPLRCLHKATRSPKHFERYKNVHSQGTTDSQCSNLFAWLRMWKVHCRGLMLDGVDACSVVVKQLDLDPQGRWFDPWWGHDKICTAVGPLSKALNPTLLQAVCLLLSLI